MVVFDFKVVGEETFYDFKTNPKGDEHMLVHIQMSDGVIKTMAFLKTDWIKGDKKGMIADWLDSRGSQ